MQLVEQYQEYCDEYPPGKPVHGENNKSIKRKWEKEMKLLST